MKLTLNQSELNSALSIVGKALSSGLVLATSCYRFKFADTLEISACNMEISISTNITCNGEELDILIPGEQLKQIVNSLPDQPLTFITDGQAITLKTSNGEYSFIGEFAENFPEIKTINGSIISMPFTDLSEALFRTSYTKLNDDTENVLNAISLEFETNKAKFVAFNGVSFALFNISGIFEPMAILLSPGFISAILNISLAGDCSINYSDKSISLLCSGYSIKGMLLDGKYLDWKPVLKIPEHSISCSRVELINAIKRVKMFTNKTSAEISLNIGTELIVKGEDVDLKNKAEEVLKCTIGESISVGVNANFTVEALSKLQSEEVFIFYSTFAKPVLFRESFNDENIAMLAPIVLKK